MLSAAKLIELRKSTHTMLDFKVLEDNYKSPTMPTWTEVANDLFRSGKGLQHTLRDSYWWIQTAHALIRDDYARLDDDDGELQITRSEIRSEFTRVLKTYWVARIEFWIGKMIPVQYVYGRKVLKHYFELTTLVNYLCCLTHHHTDLEAELDVMT